MKIVVTGAAGFLGTNLLLSLLKSNNEVIGMDSLLRKGSELNLLNIKKKFPEFNFIKSEIEDMPSVIYQTRPNLVYHFAAQVAVTNSIENPTRDYKINAEGTYYIAKAAKDTGSPVIYTSTNKVYGDNVNKLEIEELKTRYDFKGSFSRRGIKEEFSIDTSKHTPYGVSKLVGELYVREFGGIANRCSCMYGPNQHGIVDQGWLSYFATNKILENEITIYGDGKQVRDALHINDVVALLEAQGKKITGSEKDLVTGEVFNVGGGYKNTISLLELCDVWGISPKFADWRLNDQKVFYCDISKAEKYFGWQPKVDLDNGLKDLFAWTKKYLSQSKSI